MDTNFYSPTTRPVVTIFSEPNSLALSLIENLLSNFCRVTLVAKDTNRWRQITDHIKDTSNIVVYPLDTFVEIRTNYIVIFNKYSYPKSLIDNLEKTTSAKAISITPIKGKKIFDYQSPLNIYYGDLLGPRMDFDDEGLPGIISHILNDRNIEINTNESYYPVFIPELSREIVKIMFSFGPPAENVSIYSEKINSLDLHKLFLHKFPNRVFVLKDGQRKNEQTNEVVVKTQRGIETSLNETFSWFANNPPITTKYHESKIGPEIIDKPIEIKPKIEINKPLVRLNVPKVRLPKIVINRKFVVPVKYLLIICGVFIFPYLMLFISGMFMRSGLTEIKGQRVESAKGYMSVGKTFAMLSNATSKPLADFPILSYVYKPSYEISGVIISGVEISDEIFNLSAKGTELFAKMFGDSPYMIKDLVSEMSLGLDDVYRRLSFLEGEIASSKVFNSRLFKGYVKDLPLSEINKSLVSIKVVVDRLPEILGEKEPKKYMIIFQNNMELRPTGGFIGSFAIVNFEGGRMTTIDVQDVYAADGQLKGHVEPPKPIKDVLGEANWYLRDSNWDPDFTSTAKRIEWFLEKEIDTKVDGVIAIDLAVAKELVKITGPITLSDFNTQITESNLYEKTQLEVENNFFPGSYKKANFLGALTGQLLNEITSIETKRIYPMGEALMKMLNERHIQLYIHDREVEKIISTHGFSGEVLIPHCAGNCFADFFGVVDANLGVNKANYFVERSLDVETKFDQGVIDKKVSITYKNNASQGLGMGGVYKNYLRILAPKEAIAIEGFQISGESINTAKVETEEVGDRVEIGTLLEVLPSQKKTITISWRVPVALDFTSQGEYRLYIRKQAGTGEDPISLSYTPPFGLRVSSWPSFTLTRNGFYVYNTNLTRDLFVRLGW